jgi:tetratricopeptide (TPR) repeat protein
MTQTEADIWQQAHELMMSGDAALAEMLLGQAPQTGPILLLTGFAREAQGRLADAIAAFSAAKPLLPNDPAPALLEAKLTAALGDLERSESLFLSALRKFPDHIDLKSEFGTFYLDTGRPGKAIEILSTAGTRPDISFNLGIAFIRLGDLVSAQTHLLSAHHQAPTARTYDALVELACDRGQIAAADDFLRRRIVDFGHDFNSLKLTARLCVEREDWPSAAQTLAAALALAPADPTIVSDLLSVTRELGFGPRTLILAAARLGDPDAQALARLIENRPSRGEAILTLSPLQQVAERCQSPQDFAHLSRLKDAVIYSDQFYISQNNQLITDLAIMVPRGGGDLLVCGDGKGQALFRTTPVTSRLPKAILWGGSANYYHWIADDLPRLAGVLAGPDDAPIILNITHDYQEDTLAHLKFPVERIRPLAKGAAHLVDDLYIAHRPDVHFRPDGHIDDRVHFISPAATHWLRTQFLTSDPADRHPKRIYISRGQAAFRRLVNEAEIEALLAARGFVAVRLEEMSFSDQLALFSQAEAVIGPHGAGFTNLIFAPQGTKIIEFFPPGPMPGYYRAIAENLGQAHDWIAGEAVESLNHLKRAFWHFKIDSLTLDRALNQMGL